MSDFLHSYLVVGLVALVPIAMALGTLTLGKFVRPSDPSVNKLRTYESGVDPAGGGWSQSHVRYYLYALLFVVFDVEVAFIIPWAVQVEVLGTFGLVEMLIFVAILSLGLVYAWRKDVFKWQ
jgi:NADH-quinone oxidoreductase subunit A